MPRLSGLTNSGSEGRGLFAVLLGIARAQTARLGPGAHRPKQGGREKGGTGKGGAPLAVYSVCVTSTYKVTLSPG